MWKRSPRAALFHCCSPSSPSCRRIGSSRPQRCMATPSTSRATACFWRSSAARRNAFSGCCSCCCSFLLGDRGLSGRMGHACGLTGAGNWGFRCHCRLDRGLFAAVPRSPHTYDRVPGLVLKAIHCARLGIPAVLDRAATAIHRDGLARQRRLRSPRRLVHRRSHRCNHLENFLHGADEKLATFKQESFR